MNDRELLEWAAKAAGIDGKYTNEFCAIGGGGMSILEGLEYRLEGCEYSTALWNPLTDDGDALRLAVKLQFTVDFMTGTVLNRNGDHLFTDGKNPRRSIVRAAAEIGKGMK